MALQNEIEMIQDRLQRGLISSEEANVEMVRAQRFKLVSGKVPRPVRNALNAAVKNGDLGHMKKDGHKPECYYHPAFDYMAREARNAQERQTLNAVAKVAGVQI